MEDSTSCPAHFGMAIVLSNDNFSGLNYFKAWDHFLLANKYFSNLKDDDNIYIKEFFTLRDSERRNKTIRYNFDFEEKIIEDKLIKYVREENKLEIAEHFIKVYPNSKFYENVVHIRNHLEYRIAEKANTLDAFNTFLKKYPDAAQVQEAIKARNELAFQFAQKKNTIESLEEFIHIYPDAYHYYDAIKLRDQMAFDMAKKANSIEAFDRFIARYPASLHIPVAKTIQRKLLYEKAKQVNTLEAYEEFISRYPEGDYFVDIFNLKSNVLGQNMLSDVQGNKEIVKWIKGFDFEQKNDSAGGLVVTPDNRIVISGTRHKKDQSGKEAWLIGIDNSGKTLWNKPFGSNEINVVNMATLTPQGDILLAGWNSMQTDTLSRKSWIFKVSSNGNGQWERNVDGKEIEALAIAASEDIYVSGYNSTDSLPSVLYLMKLNKNFQKLWSRDYIKAGKLSSFAVTPAQNIVAASGKWLWKTDSQGYIQWEKLLPSTDSLIAVNSIPGGIFYISGARNSTAYLAKVNDQGNIQWEKNWVDMAGLFVDYAYNLPDKTIFTRFHGAGILGFMVISDKGDIIKEIRFPNSLSTLSHSIIVNAAGEIFTVFTKNNFSNTEIIVCKMLAK